MSDEALVRLARQAEDMAHNPNVPPAEQELWALILTDISTYLGAEQEPTQDGPGLFEAQTATDIPAHVPPLVSRQGGTAWKAGDTCHACGSTDTVWLRDGVLVQAHCNGCGRNDWDDD